MRKFLISLPVSAMIGKQGNNFTKAKIFKKVCKTLFVTVTILLHNFLLNNCCIKIMVDTFKIMENVTMTKVIFLQSTPCLRLSVDVFLLKYLTHCNFARLTLHYVITSTLKRHRHNHNGKPCKGIGPIENRQLRYVVWGK